MKIAVIGSGYVGLVTSVCLAEVGYSVTGVDIDTQKVDKLNKGIPSIMEQDMDVYLKRNIEAKRLRFITSITEALAVSDLIFLALPTPPNRDGSADLSYILEVAAQIGELITSYKVIINKSTVPVGTASKVKAFIRQKTSMDFDVVSNPEFLREGVAIHYFMNPERIIIGSESERAIHWLRKLYAPFIRNEKQFIIMDETSAELTKYAANSFLAMKITYINELANLCERTGAKIDCIKRGIGTDSRIGDKFLNPGIGFGGSCFPKDIRALIQIAKDYEYDFRIIKAIKEANDKQKIALIPKIKGHFNGEVKGKHFAIWGLSFKPRTDDIREACSLYTIEKLLKLGATITAYDPKAISNVKALWGDKINYAQDAMKVLKGADALVICTEWPVFQKISLIKIKQALKSPVVFDGRNIFNPEEANKEGIIYYSIGR